MAIVTQQNPEAFTTPFLALSNRNHTAIRAAQQGALHFLNKTLQYNVDALEGLRKCRGLPGLMAVEHQWMSRVMRDTMEQTQRMANVWWQFAEDETQAEQAEESTHSQPVVKRKVVNGRKSKHPGRKYRAAANVTGSAQRRSR